MTPPPHGPLRVLTRPALPDERAYLLHSWSEGYKGAPRMHKLTWTLFREFMAPKLGAILDAPHTRTLVAVQPGGSDVIGWLAYSPGRRVSTVHWAHTRFRVGKDGAHLRRRGVFNALLAAADLGTRWVYTHRGPRQRVAGKETTDAMLVRALAKRGVTAAYVSMEEWLR